MGVDLLITITLLIAMIGTFWAILQDSKTIMARTWLAVVILFIIEALL